MADWRCVYDEITGEAISYGTDIQQPVLPGQAFAMVDGPPSDEIMWDNVTHRMVPRPEKTQRVGTTPLVKP